jgi:uncharacterized protein YndB with AHSA1/START domain
MLDAWGAGGRPYREIADWLTIEHGLSNWWAQKLIVEYEQARGLRDAGIRRDGTFEVGASKTIDAGPEEVLDAFDSPDARERWLPVALHQTERSSGRVRLAWTDGHSRVTVSLSAASGRKTLVAIQHDRLRDGKAAAEMRAFWRERLTTLKDLLESQRAGGPAGRS